MPRLILRAIRFADERQIASRSTRQRVTEVVEMVAIRDLDCERPRQADKLSGA
jgi:hypothetical protein